MVGAALDRVDLGRDLIGRPGGLRCQVLHLGGHHREALAVFAGARRLDGGIEGKQIGLRRDRVDQLDDLTDARDRGDQALHHLGGTAGLRHRTGRDLGGGGCLLADLIDRFRQFIDCGRDRAHVVDCMLGRGGDRASIADRCHSPRLLIRSAFCCNCAAAAATMRATPMTSTSKVSAS